MKRAAKLAPSFASTAEYPARLRAWQADTQHVHDQYARLHHALRDDLFQLLEQKQNQVCTRAIKLGFVIVCRVKFSNTLLSLSLSLDLSLDLSRPLSLDLSTSLSTSLSTCLHKRVALRLCL